MKKLIAILIALCLVTVPACSTSPSGNPDTGEDKVSVVTTNFPPYDFTREIAGDKAEVTMLLPPGAESHSFEPTPQDIIKIGDSDIFIYTGGESDVWVDEILESLDGSDTKIIKMMDSVDVVEEEIVEGMEEDGHDHGHEEEGHEEDAHSDEHADESHAEEEHTDEHTDDHAEEESHIEDEHSDEHAEEENHAEDEHAHEGVVLDEHVWTSPKNAQKIVATISETLQSIDTSNADLYAENTARLTEELAVLDNEFREIVNGAVRHTFVFGDRFPLRYFADEYGLEYFAAFPGCSTDTEPSAQTVAFLIDKIRDEKIPAVFHIEFSNEKMAETIADETGVKNLLFHSAHNVSKDEMDAGEGYISLMRANEARLKEALS